MEALTNLFLLLLAPACILFVVWFFFWFRSRLIRGPDGEVTGVDSKTLTWVYARPRLLLAVIGCFIMLRLTLLLSGSVHVSSTALGFGLLFGGAVGTYATANYMAKSRVAQAEQRWNDSPTRMRWHLPPYNALRILYYVVGLVSMAAGLALLVGII
jgi:hypothetical protein